MKIYRTLLTFIVVGLVIAPLAYAGEGHGEHHPHKQIQLVLGDGDATVIDVSDLEEGESRQMFAGDKELVITHTGDGLAIEVDGEEINIGGLGDHHVHVESLDGDLEQLISSSHSKVIVKRLGGDGDSDGFHFIGENGEDVDFEFDLDGDHTWVSADGERHVMVLGDAGMGLGGEVAAQHLQSTGVLDDLDEAKRDAILEALRSMQGPHMEVDKEVIVIRKGADDVH